MLKGKTALVTGSTSGIGLGIAKALAQQGANIVLNGFGDAEGPKSQVAALGVQAEYHGADMSKPDQIEDMMKFAAVRHRRGFRDVLVPRIRVFSTHESSHLRRVGGKRWPGDSSDLRRLGSDRSVVVTPRQRLARHGRVGRTDRQRVAALATTRSRRGPRQP